MTTAKPRTARPPAVDKRLLSADDYEQYQTFSRRWNRGPTLREQPGIVVFTAIIFVAGGGFIAAVASVDGLPPEQVNRIMTPVCALLAVLTVFFVWFALRSRRRWRIKLNAEAETFLRERIKDAPSGDRDDDEGGISYWWTGNYDPRRYYQSFSGMTREERDYISSAYDDLDTYESNRPD